MPRGQDGNIVPQKAYTEAEIREIDRTAIEARGISAAELMERAGEAVWRAIRHSFAPAYVAIVCGKGNNGGDGFVVARLAAEEGRRVVVLSAADPAENRGEARVCFDRMPEHIRPRAKASIQEIEEALAEADLIVDALLGTGSHGPARADTARMIETINAVSERKNIPVVAVDIPSGLPSDAGWKGEGPVVRATLTIAIGGPKLGEIVEPGASRTGRLEIAPIGFPADLLYAKKIQGHLMTADYVASLLPDRASDAHKGTFGRCLIVAGSMGLGGAAALAALGALRGGAGLIHAAVPEAIYPAVLPVAPEAIFHPLGGPGSRFFRGEDASELSGADWFGSIDAAVLGPGLGGREETVSFAKRVLDSFEKPLILDADALAALKSFGRLPDRRAEVVGIVPHPGEMARLMDKSVADIQKDRIGCAREAAKRFNCHVLLKGARTVIAEPCGRYFINPTGNTGLAKGGSGDVLAGLIGALLAQGMTIADALRAGAYLHGLAADLLAERPDASVRSILPTEVAAHLGAAFRTVEKARE